MKFYINYSVNNVDCQKEIEASNLEEAEKLTHQWRTEKVKFRYQLKEYKYSRIYTVTN